jgi:hypothetical protein
MEIVIAYLVEVTGVKGQRFAGRDTVHILISTGAGTLRQGLLCGRSVAQEEKEQQQFSVHAERFGTRCGYTVYYIRKQTLFHPEIYLMFRTAPGTSSL